MILSKGLTRLGGVVALAALLLGLGLASAPAAHAQAPTILWGEAPAGDSVIAAWVDGVECETATVAADEGSSTGYSWSVQIDDGECDASAGSEIAFSVDGEVANETVSFSPGLATAVTLTYDMGGMGDGDDGMGDGDDGMGDGDDGMGDGDDGMGDGDDGMGDGDGGMDVEPPDTGNAGLAASSSASHALALGLGALAVAMLAGARSVTGRSR